MMEQRNYADLTAEQKPRFDAWCNRKGFKVADDLTHNINDAAEGFLDAVREWMKLRACDPDFESTRTQFAQNALDWLTPCLEIERIEVHEREED
jgi:hypothetical protein